MGLAAGPASTLAHAGATNAAGFKPVWDLHWPAELRGRIQTTEVFWKSLNVAKPSFEDDLAAAKAFIPSSQNPWLRALEVLREQAVTSYPPLEISGSRTCFANP